MKKILTFLSFAISLAVFSQTNYYQNNKGIIIDIKGYEKEKQQKLKDVKKQLGNNFDIEAKLDLMKTAKDSIIYKYSFITLPTELKLEREQLNKFKNKKFVINQFDFLNPEDKSKIDLSKPTFINFWFTTCPPCIEEIPALNELREKFDGKINFISITFNTKEQVLKFLTKHDFKFAHVTNQQKLIDAYGISGYPKSFILDNSQNLIYIEDAIPSKDYEKAYQAVIGELETKINKLL